MVDEAVSTKDEEQMAACGACGSLLPMDSKSCDECGVSFSGLNTEPMGECTACGAMNLLSSKQCWRCNIMFIGLDDVDGDGELDLVSEDTSFSEEKKAAAEAEAEAKAEEEAEAKAEEEAEESDDSEDDEDSEDEDTEDEEDSEDEDSEEESEDEESEDEESEDEESEDEDVEEESEDEDSTTSKKGFMSQIFPEDADFPTDMQTRLSSKKWIDVIFPLMLTVFGILLIGTAVNQFVGIPIDMDGDAATAAESRTVMLLQHFGLAEGDTSGDTGMSFHFNTFILLVSILMFSGSLGMYLLARGWKPRIIEIKKSEAKSSEDEESEDEESEDEESEDEDSDDEDSDDEDSEDEDSEDEDSDDEDSEDDEIDVGSRVGVSIEHDDGDVEEFYGEIIEFDDDNDEVVVKDEETGEEVIVPQDSLFLD